MEGANRTPLIKLLFSGRENRGTEGLGPCLQHRDEATPFLVPELLFSLTGTLLGPNGVGGLGNGLWGSPTSGASSTRRQAASQMPPSLSQWDGCPSARGLPWVLQGLLYQGLLKAKHAC